MKIIRLFSAIAAAAAAAAAAPQADFVSGISDAFNSPDSGGMLIALSSVGGLIAIMLLLVFRRTTKASAPESEEPRTSAKKSSAGTAEEKINSQFVLPRLGADKPIKRRDEADADELEKRLSEEE